MTYDIRCWSFETIVCCLWLEFKLLIIGHKKFPSLFCFELNADQFKIEIYADGLCSHKLTTRLNTLASLHHQIQMWLKLLAHYKGALFVPSSLVHMPCCCGKRSASVKSWWNPGDRTLSSIEQESQPSTADLMYYRNFVPCSFTKSSDRDSDLESKLCLIQESRTVVVQTSNKTPTFQ